MTEGKTEETRPGRGWGGGIQGLVGLREDLGFIRITDYGGSTRGSWELRRGVAHRRRSRAPSGGRRGTD